MFCEAETIHYKKINKSVLNTITFNLEDDNIQEVRFNGQNFDFYITIDRNLISHVSTQLFV